MKKSIVLFLLLAVSAFPVRSQHYIGARAGWGAGYGRFSPVTSYPMKFVLGTWSGGIQWKYYGQVRYIGAVGAELEFIQRAYQQQASLDSENYKRVVYNTLNLPLIWHIHLNLADNRFRIFLNAGVWASYNISAYEWRKNGEQITEGPYHMILVRDNPLGYGLLGGVGANYVIGKWELMLEARYYFSYGDILRNNAVYAGNPVRSPLDNITLSLGFFYRIGDKPHAPVPPPWYARMIAKREARKGLRGEAELAAPQGEDVSGTENADGMENVSGIASDSVEDVPGGDGFAEPPTAQGPEAESVNMD